ncbi:MAG: hypothetical protein A2X12_05210 [Bacteroidetes bacterium GWE2_29_8]|nr:MAG: hypothetical protein A2X12_05210 [Bacteroidetes bacterium GWE2_29_8]OFY15558.1 MAG: hypothetical protein A2X02_04205 [Bacteroidetes bacterium GWF2_29_10]
MPGIINLLPDSVANQIAAGEVIQRPASVVKELIENSIDAKSSVIKLIIKDAGRTLIQITDNGLGMNDTDARLCFERHATSKIKSAEDLFKIRSMGFRGEALAAISAISQVEMKTKQENSNLGTKIVIEGFEFISQESVNCSKGTSFEIKNLFFNTPARRNFLKSNAVEYRHIIEEFERVALSFPEISFYLYNNDQEIYALEKTNNLKQRIVSYFGSSYNHKLINIEENTKLFKLSGYLSKPEHCKKTRGEQFIFVNNRFIKSTYINNAIINAYSQYVSSDFFPSYFIYIDIDPSKIDINIHPTKTEIKFEDATTLWSIINSSVRKSIGTFANVPTIDFEQNKSIDIPHITKDTTFKIPEVTVDKTFNPFDVEKKLDNRIQQYSNKFKDKGSIPNNWELLYNKFESIPEITDKELPTVNLNNDSQIKNFQEEAKKITNFDNNYLLIQNKVIVTKLTSGLVFINIKRAIERIYFEQYYNNYKNNKCYSNQIIFPISFSLAEDKIKILIEIENEIKSMGFDYEIQNNNNVCINGIPDNIKEADCEDIFNDSINNHVEKTKDVNYEKIIEISKTLAKKVSLRIKPNTSEEINNIIAKLFSSSQPEYSPDWQKIIKIIAYEELDNLFI